MKHEKGTNYYAYIFNFPQIDIENPHKQILKIDTEIEELDYALNYFEEKGKCFNDVIIELMDVIHACETLLYYFCDKFGYELLDNREAVIDKNDERGYYD